MIIISDTSPINYLILIGQIDLLPQLFEQIIIPEAVYNIGVARIALFPNPKERSHNHEICGKIEI